MMLQPVTDYWGSEMLPWPPTCDIGGSGDKNRRSSEDLVCVIVWGGRAEAVKKVCGVKDCDRLGRQCWGSKEGLWICETCWKGEAVMDEERRLVVWVNKESRCNITTRTTSLIDVNKNSMSVCLFVCVCVSVCVSVCLCVCLYMLVSVCLSVCMWL